jgi:RNA polymerase sigma factor (sigma-70 family)
LLATEDADPMATLEQRDRVSLLRRAMAALPEPLRTAVLMRDIRELSYQEIAEALHLPDGTVKSRINRGRAELARQIRKLHGGDIRQAGPTVVHNGAAPPRAGALR